MYWTDQLRKAKTVHQLFDSFDIDPYSATFNEKVNQLANVIESFYYEKPRSANGMPIHLGSEWYGEDGRRWYVVGYRAGKYDILACSTPCYTHPQPLKSNWLRMERPDSWGLIIDDAISLTDTQKKAELIERCKKLAGERND